MNDPRFHLPKSFIDGSPEAIGLPDADNFLSYKKEDEELENGQLEREAQQLWFEQQQENYFDEMENF